MFDYLEGPIPYKGDRFEDLAKDKIFSDPKTYEAMRNYMFDEGDEYKDEEDYDEEWDNNFDDYEDDLDDEDDEDDYPSRKGRRGRRGRR
jgi:serine/threonine-protein kinase